MYAIKVKNQIKDKTERDIFLRRFSSSWLGSYVRSWRECEPNAGRYTFSLQRVWKFKNKHDAKKQAICKWEYVVKINED